MLEQTVWVQERREECNECWVQDALFFHLQDAILSLHPKELLLKWLLSTTCFHDEAFVEAFEAQLDGRPVDLVLCDIAPNISGIPLSDQARSIHLAELALEFAEQHLASHGRFLVKVFQGEGFDAFRKAMGEVFKSVVVRKPQASRGRSAEVYLLGTGKR